MRWVSTLPTKEERYIADDGSVIGVVDQWPDTGRWSVKYLGQSFSDEFTRPLAMHKVMTLYQGDHHERRSRRNERSPRPSRRMTSNKGGSRDNL